MLVAAIVSPGLGSLPTSRTKSALIEPTTSNGFLPVSPYIVSCESKNRFFFEVVFAQEAIIRRNSNALSDSTSQTHLLQVP